MVNGEKAEQVFAIQGQKQVTVIAIDDRSRGGPESMCRKDKHRTGLEGADLVTLCIEKRQPTFKNNCFVKIQGKHERPVQELTKNRSSGESAPTHITYSITYSIA